MATLLESPPAVNRARRHAAISNALPAGATSPPADYPARIHDSAVAEMARLLDRLKMVTAAESTRSAVGGRPSRVSPATA